MSSPELPPNAEFSAISKNGLINLTEIELKMVQAIPLYYDAGGRWWGPDTNGYSQMKDSQAATYVTLYGFSKSDKASNSHGQKPADRALLWLKQNNKVSYAGQLAGYNAGLHQCGPDRILVTERTAIVEPKKGECPKIRELIESMLVMEGKNCAEQIAAFYTVVAQRYNTIFDFLNKTSSTLFRHCPALAIVGPKGCGKSALIDLVLKPLFGGRTADPTSYLNQPDFNKDLFIAPLLVMDDKGSPPTLAIRRERGENIKGLIWTPEQRMRGMFSDAIQLTPFRFLVMACNDEESPMQILPTMNRAMEDKIIHLLCKQAEYLPPTNAENDQWVKDLRDELPAFAYFLRAYRPPKKAILNNRSRVIEYHHQFITDSLRAMQPEMKLLGLIDHYKLWDNTQGFWYGTSTEFQADMLKLDEEHQVFKGMFSNPTAIGRALMELVKVAPERITDTNVSNVRHYKIRPATIES